MTWLIVARIFDAISFLITSTGLTPSFSARSLTERLGGRTARRSPFASIFVATAGLKAVRAASIAPGAKGAAALRVSLRCCRKLTSSFWLIPSSRASSCAFMPELLSMPPEPNSKPQGPSANHASAGTGAPSARSKARRLRASSTHAGSAWTYAPRPLFRPVRSLVTVPSGMRTKRTSSAFPASCLHATQVLTGRCAFVLGIARLDVDSQPRQLRREARILTVAADRQRQLVAGHEHRRGPRCSVDRHPVDPRRAERRGHERLGVVRPRHDVDVLVHELAEDRAVADALRADACADGIEA